MVIAVCKSFARQQLVNRFRTGLVYKAHRLVYHSNVGSRVIKKKKREEDKKEVAVC